MRIVVGILKASAVASLLMVWPQVFLQPIAYAREEEMPSARRCQDARLQPAHQQFGQAADGVRDARPGAPSYLDVENAELLSFEESERLELRLVTGLFPASGSVKAIYRFLFDTDGRTVTGRSVEGVAGIEREVRIEATGDQALGSVNVVGSVLDYVSNKKASLPTTVKHSHVVVTDVGSDEPVGESFSATIPRALVALEADQVPVTLIAQDAGENIGDIASFVFNQKAWEPYVKLTLGSAAVGEPMSFAVKALTPNATFTLSIQPMYRVLVDKLGRDGSFSGAFILPPLWKGSYFVEARDEAGAFAFALMSCAP